jgi:hypothetical protein
MGSDIVGRWSPDCSQYLTWGGDPGFAQTGSFTIGTDNLPPHFLVRELPITPGAFLTNDTVLYCANAVDRVELRAHTIGQAKPDQVIGELSAATTKCDLASSTNGRAVVVATQSARRAAILDESDTPVAITSADDWRFPVAFLDDNTLVVAKLSQGGSEWNVSTAMLRDAAPTRRLWRVELKTHAETSTPACDGEIGNVVRDGSLLHVVREATKTGSQFVLLEDQTCKPVSTFPVPQAESWSVPSCNATVCIAGGRKGDEVILYRLEAAAAVELGRVKRTSPYPDPLVALSPSGARAVLTINGDITYHVFAVASPGAPLASHTVITKDPARTFIQALSWGADEDHFYLSGFTIDGQGGLFLADLKGARRYLPKSKVEAHLVVGPRSPSGRPSMVLGGVDRKTRWYMVDLER